MLTLLDFFLRHR